MTPELRLRLSGAVSFTSCCCDVGVESVECPLRSSCSKHHTVEEVHSRFYSRSRVQFHLHGLCNIWRKYLLILTLCVGERVKALCPHWFIAAV